jgi:hypothetical protein
MELRLEVRMSMKIVDCIAGSAEPEIPVLARRSSAQIEASRRNGAQSRGPITAEGKARSRSNALKHGLLARVIAPSTDVRRDDQLYRDIRRALVDELCPTSFTEHARIDTLALDYVRLKRVNQMLEELQRAKSSLEDAEKWQGILHDRKDLKLIDRLLPSLGATAKGDCTVTEARHLARRVVASVRNIELDIAAEEADAMIGGLPDIPEPEWPTSGEPSPDDSQETEIDEGGAGGSTDSSPASNATQVERPKIEMSKADQEMEEKEEREFQELASIIRSACGRLRDENYITSVLSGAAQSRAGDWKRLGKLLKYIRDWIAERQSSHKAFEGRLHDAGKTHAQTLARAPEQLMLLHEYLRRIERDIDQKLVWLHGR